MHGATSKGLLANLQLQISNLVQHGSGKLVLNSKLWLVLALLLLTLLPELDLSWLLAVPYP